MDALILAGGKNSEAMKQLTGVSYEAMIPIGGRPMVAWVVEVLHSLVEIDRVFVVGSVGDLSKCIFPTSTQLLPAGATLFDTLQNGLTAVNHSSKVLIATCDIPLITATAVRQFLIDCNQIKADIYYPIIEKNSINKFYPEAKRTYVTLQEGVFTGGNIVLVDAELALNCLNQAKYILDNRKKIFNLCWFLGLSFIIRLMAGRLSLNMIENRLSAMFKIKGKAIPMAFAELGMDIDKPSDLQMIAKQFNF